MCVIVLYRNISLYLRFFNFSIFFAYQLCGNLNISPSMNRILLNLKEILVNAWILQNYGDLFADGLQKELCALECRKLHAKCEKKSNFYCGIFLSFR